VPFRRSQRLPLGLLERLALGPPLWTAFRHPLRLARRPASCSSQREPPRLVQPRLIPVEISPATGPVVSDRSLCCGEQDTPGLFNRGFGPTDPRHPIGTLGKSG